MSKHIKRSGWFAVPFLIVGAGLLVSSLYPLAQAGPVTQPGHDPLEIRPSDGGGPSMNIRALSIGPVAGLTTAWHRAPAETSIPLGTTVLFSVPADPMNAVRWTGAEEVQRDETGSIAECRFEQLGTAEVDVKVTVPGSEPLVYSSVLYVVDVSADQIELGLIEVSVEPVDLDEDSTNEETMDYYFNSYSIAGVTAVGSRQYRTSVVREVQMSVKVDPPGFAPLIEWRVDGEPVLLGGSVVRSHREIGVHAVSAGPPANPQWVRIETYRVTIISPEEGEIIPEGEPVTFTAVTDPPGYEEDITWLSTTKYGTAVPVLGQGPTFTVQFDDTFGDDPVYGYFQWLGVKADNDTRGQDQKIELGACCLPPDYTCSFITFDACTEAGGDFAGPDTGCAEVACEVCDEPAPRSDGIGRWPVPLHPAGPLFDLSGLRGVVFSTPDGASFIVEDAVLAKMPDGRIFFQSVSGYTANGEWFAVDNSDVAGVQMWTPEDYAGAVLVNRDTSFLVQSVGLAVTEKGRLIYSSFVLMSEDGALVEKTNGSTDGRGAGCDLVSLVWCQCPVLDVFGDCPPNAPPFCGAVCGLLSIHNCVPIIGPPFCLDTGCGAAGGTCCTTRKPNGTIVACPCLVPPG